MTELTLPSASRVPSAGRVPHAGRSILLWGTVAVAALLGAVAGMHGAADARTVEGTLALLLRFMALVKAVVALAAALLVGWRLARPLEPATFARYLAALMPMAAAPGLIWSLGLVAPGALLFHVGFLAFLVLAARDDAVGARLSGLKRRAR